MSTKSFNNPWGSDWTDFQSNYLNSINSFFPNSAATQNPFSQNPWSQSMDYWWQTNRPSLPSDHFDMVNKILTQGKSLYFLGDQLVQLLDTFATQKRVKDDWRGTLDKQIEMMKQSFFNEAGLMDNGLLNEWQSAQATMQSMINAIPGLSDLPKGNISDTDVHEYIEKYLSMPGLGLNRELQEKVQETFLSYKQYQDVNEEYRKAMSDVSVKGLDRLKAKLVKLAESKQKIESLRQVYDLWVDSSEESYAEYTLGEDYSKLYGKLVNSMMAYKKNNSELMEELHSAYNIPSKKDFDELTKVQYLLKHKFRDGEQAKRRELKRIDKLEKEKQKDQQRIAMLEQELEQLREAISGSASDKIKPKPQVKKTRAKATMAKKKNTVKKKAAKKKTGHKPAVDSKPKKTSTIDDSIIEIKF